MGGGDGGGGGGFQLISKPRNYDVLTVSGYVYVFALNIVQ